jgi:protein-S-isoprenylcysteine O-methyltransferase Ste14
MNLQTPQAVFLAGLTGYLIVRAVYQRRGSGSLVSVQRSSVADRLLVLLVIGGQIIIPLFYVLTPWLNAASYAPLQGTAGLGALAWVTGLWVFWRSHADLGKNWAVSLVLHRDHRLVTCGVYRAVRHPMYSSFLLLGVGQALLLPNWFAGPAALVAVSLMCALRIPEEEAMMTEHFGQEYRDYVQQTGRLIPRLPGMTGGA